MRIAVIGGGAAGFFFACNIQELLPEAIVTIYEAGNDLLEKVRISGGGRCNVTHACFDPRELATHYPRGQQELLSVFRRFQPTDTLEWFARRGVAIQAEEDGRMFPVTNRSETIIDCLMSSAKRSGVRIQTNSPLNRIQAKDNGWKLEFAEGKPVIADRVMLATGSQLRVWKMLREMGVQIIDAVPSLFTFTIRSPLLADLAGISFPKAIVQAPEVKLKTQGPLLITHWGLSGPAILRMSAWGARLLHEKKYRFALRVNFTGLPAAEVQQIMADNRRQHAARKLSNRSICGLPRRFWERIITQCGAGNANWGDLRKEQLQQIIERMTDAPLEVVGKSTYKEEFVTAGGVARTEVNFRTMESVHFPGLYFAGEVIDIDGITGGFNFQAAWSEAWVAATAIAKPQQA